MAGEFESLKALARRAGEQDRLLWLNTHSEYPEAYFKSGTQPEILSEIERCTFEAIDRMVYKCTMMGFEPSRREKELLTFEHMTAFYLDKLIEEMDAEICVIAGEQPSGLLYEMIRSSL